MANLSFVDAINDFRRKSVLAGRPAEKAAMDRSLRENAIRRLTTTRDRVAPVTPAISEVVQGGGDMMEPPLDTAAGTQGVPGGISGVQAGVIGQNTANTMEGVLASMLGFEKGEQGYQPTPTMPLSTLSFLQPGLIQKGFQIAKPLVQSSLSSGKTGMNTAQFVQDTPLGLNFSDESEEEGDVSQASSQNGPPAAPAPTAAMGDTVLCTELYRQGLLPLEIYIADSRYGSKLAPETLAGYHVWAEPLARAMSQSRGLTSIVAPFVQAWAGEMAYREGVLSKGNWLGKVLAFIGEPVCGFIGRSLNYGYEPDIY